jgi:solute carrier family 25 (peroxisomal adenine nucleotide transporter), member 17
MLAGLIAGSATVILTNPIWVVNTRETAKKDVEEGKGLAGADTTAKVTPRRRGFIQILLDIIKSEGVGALWSGVVPALVLVINPIIQYTVFEQFKAVLEKRRNSKLTPNDAFLLGALGKLLATGITYPYSNIQRSDDLILVTIKARMQLKQSKDANEQYTGTVAGLKKIVRDEGLTGLYKGEIGFNISLTVGVGPKLTQSVLNAAFLFMFKEFFFNHTQAILQRAAHPTPTVLDASKTTK